MSLVAGAHGGNSVPLIEVRNLSKTFPGQRALQGVNLSVRSGEIVAVVGQNGSGKSTLVKLLSGVHEPDPGARIEIRHADGTRLAGRDAAGSVHVIHQDLGLIPSLSVVENLGLFGRRDSAGQPLARIERLRGSRQAERRRAQELIGRFGVSVNVDAAISELSPAERTIVAIARAMDGWERSDQVLLLDEATAALHEAESRRLFSAVRRLAAAGAAVIFISHRLEEVLALCDRVVAIREGQVMADTTAVSLDTRRLAELITGTDAAAQPRATTESLCGQSAVLSVRGLTGQGVNHLDLSVAAGEVVGIAGILGSGRERVAALLAGAIARTSGTVSVGDRTVREGDPRQALEAGLAYVPADRLGDGAVAQMRARENLTLAALGPLRRRFGWLSTRAERHDATEWFRRVKLDPLEPERDLANFSGGNQQKILLAKWLRTNPRVLVLDEPTQGVDVGARAGIYELLFDACARGTAAVVCSSDARELAYLCDRVQVMRNGTPSAVLHRSDVTERKILEACQLGIDQLVEVGL